MYCKSCGFQIEDDSKYCRRCGYEATGNISPGYQENPGNKQKKIAMIIALAIVLLMAAVGIILFTSMEDSPGSKADRPSIYRDLA